MKKTVRQLLHTALSHAWRTWARRASALSVRAARTTDILRRAILAILRKALHDSFRSWKQFVESYHVTLMMNDAAEAHTRMKSMRDEAHSKIEDMHEKAAVRDQALHAMVAHGNTFET